MKKEVTSIIINRKEFNNNTPKREIYDEIIASLEEGKAYGEIEELVNLYYYGKIKERNEYSSQ